MTDIVDPNAIPDWQQKLAALARQTLESERPPGQYFGTKSGILTFNKIPLAGNQMDVAITAAVFENAFYPDAYDPENIVPPHCYAFGVGSDLEMAPHEQAYQPQHTDCATCPHAKFGTAKTGTGKGKACRNLRRLCVIPAASLTSYDAVKKSPAGFVRLAVFSGLAWGAYVRTLSLEGKSPFQVVTRMKLIPDVRAQFKFSFENIGPIADEAMEAIMVRHDFDVGDLLEPYPAMELAQAAPAAAPAAPGLF